MSEGLRCLFSLTLSGGALTLVVAGVNRLLRRRVPAAVFAKYDSREYNDCIHADEQQWYFMEREFERRKEQLGQNAPGSRR